MLSIFQKLTIDMRRIPSPPNFAELLADHAKDLHKIIGASPVTERGKYLHYDELRHRPVPEGLTLDLWWLGMKLARQTSMTQLPLTDPVGRSFRFAMTAPNYEILHEIDAKGAGRIAMPEQISKSGPKERFLIRSLVEEAITSSQLEGASTTRKAAMDMFRTGRKPVNKAERMILNNWLGMAFIKAHKDKDLTPEFVLELHRQMTKDTLDPEHVGRLQTPEDERIHVGSNQDGEVLHHPPPAEQLPARLRAMCNFANGLNESEFLHPVIRAIILHFWLAYDHPFEDGNGRTARALFYWSMLKRGYWLFEFISISAILKRAQAQYARSFLYTESDDNDATYFITYQLEVIRAALHAAENYLERHAKRIADTETKLKGQGHFNYRQLALLSHALRNPHSEYTVQSHRSSHDVSKGTARTDLQGLVKHELLAEFHPEGERVVIYRPTRKLAEI
jgi:Fic family protein